MICPYCHNDIKEIEKCPECKKDMIFVSGEGPMGTWECRKCSTKKQIRGYRTSPFGLVITNDLVGRYSIKKT